MPTVAVALASTFSAADVAAGAALEMQPSPRVSKPSKPSPQTQPTDYDCSEALRNDPSQTPAEPFLFSRAHSRWPSLAAEWSPEPPLCAQNGEELPTPPRNLCHDDFSSPPQPPTAKPPLLLQCDADSKLASNADLMRRRDFPDSDATGEFEAPKFSKMHVLGQATGEEVLQGVSLPDDQDDHTFYPPVPSEQSSDDTISKKDTVGSSYKRERLPRLLLVYAEIIETRPYTFLIVYFVLITLLIFVFWRPVKLEEDLSAFARADGQASRYKDARDAALTARVELEADEVNRRLESESTNPAYEDLWTARGITFYYIARNGGNILDERCLREARDFEAKLRGVSKWSEWCHERSGEIYPRWLCDPGETFLAFAWPLILRANSDNFFDLNFTGTGTELFPVPAVLAYLARAGALDTTDEAAVDLHRYFAKDDVADGSNRLSSMTPESLRSRFTFSIVFGDTSMSPSASKASKDEMDQEYKDFMINDVYPVLKAQSRAYKYIEVYYSESNINEYEVLHAMQTDILWALGSILFVTLYIGVHVRNFQVTVGSFFVIFASVPLAYVLTPAAKTTFASLMSLFLITVIDIDIIFVFNDFWAQSVHLDMVSHRLAWTLIKAGKSCLATSLTTSLSFFANLLSCMQPLREFGLFMGLCVTNVFVLAILFLPPLFVIRHGRRRRPMIATTPTDDPICDTTPTDYCNSVEKPILKLSTAHIHQPSIDTALAPSLSPGCGSEPVPVAVATASVHQGSLHGNAAEDVPLSYTFIFLSGLVDCTSACPCIIILLTLVLTLGAVVGVAMDITLDQGQPQIFQSNHNQVRYKEVLSKFNSVDSLAQLGTRLDLHGAVCSAEGKSIQNSKPEPCDFQWCSATIRDLYDAGWGSCWLGPPTLLDRGNQTSLDACGRLRIYTRTMSANSSDKVFKVMEGWKASIPAITNFAMDRADWRGGSVSLSNSGPLMIEDWETGSVSSSDLSDVETLLAYNNLPGKSVCEANAICFFGQYQCHMPGWREVYTFSLADPNKYVINGGSLPSLVEPVAASSKAFCAPDEASRRRTRDYSCAKVASKFGCPTISTVPFPELRNTCQTTCHEAVGCEAPTPEPTIEAPEPTAAPTQADCIDIEPPSEWQKNTCQKQQAVGNCDVQWFVETGFCQKKCGRCQAPTEPTIEALPEPTAAPTQASAGRKLLTAVVPEARQIYIEVYYGLQVPLYTPLVGSTPEAWRFDERFKPENPWAQRAMMQMCTEPAPNLRVVWEECWIREFKTWLEGASPKRRFPSRTFHADAQTWRGGAEEVWWDKLWIVNGKVKACRLEYWVDVDSRSDSYEILDYKGEWDAYIKEYNKQASVTANAAWHHSKTWVQTEAKIAVITSTLSTIITELSIAWVGICFFTGDPVLATLVLCMMLVNTIGLTFFMVVIMQWALGPIEIICLVMFLGYSVTFGLHMSHNYSHVGIQDSEMVRIEAWIAKRSKDLSILDEEETDEEQPMGKSQSTGSDASTDSVHSKLVLDGYHLRKARTRMAVLRVGKAIMSSTLSTIGSSLFLLMCSLNLFIRLGQVIAAVVTLSLVSTMLVLPAVLVLLGPSPDPCYTRLTRQWLIQPCLSLIDRRNCDDSVATDMRSVSEGSEP